MFFALSYRSKESFRPQSDVEGIGIFEADVHVPWILAIVHTPFESSVRPRIMTLLRSKTNCLISGTAHRQHVILARKASKARLFYGRRRLGVTARA